MTKKKPKQEIIVKETFQGRVDINAYFRVLIMESINRDQYNLEKKEDYRL